MIVDGMKECSKCGEVKPIEEFWIKDSKTNRRDSVCKKCRNEVRNKNNRLLGIKERKRVINKPGFRTCNKCKTEKPLLEFHKCRTNPGGFQYVCKECRVAIDAKVSVKRKEKYRREHPIKLIPTHKICKGCGIDKPLEEFRNDYRLKSGKGARCLICSRPPKKPYVKRVMSEEAKKKISIAHIGLPAWNKGKHMPPGFGEGVSKRNRNRTYSPETIQKMSESHKGEKAVYFGKHLPEETRKK